MLNKELINRMETFFKKLPNINVDYVEKYFRKLKSEKELGITDYNVLGIGNKSDSIVVDLKYKDDFYRCSLLFREDKITGLQIINPDDLVDLYLNQW